MKKVIMEQRSYFWNSIISLLWVANVVLIICIVFLWFIKFSKSDLKIKNQQLDEEMEIDPLESFRGNFPADKELVL